MENPLMRLQWLTERELVWCLHFNRAAHKQRLESLFAIVSRLGDGIFWYGLLVSLLLAKGLSALPAVGHMLAVGILGLILYGWIKAKTGRARPCVHNTLIRATVAALDQYSFPSGHTLHAVAFSMVASYYYPRLAWLIIPFTVLVALSRLVLGLHYPSDVLAGALLGAALAVFVLQF
jgi:undecaprenyl-diphosphatase